MQLWSRFVAAVLFRMQLLGREINQLKWNVNQLQEIILSLYMFSLTVLYSVSRSIYRFHTLEKSKLHSIYV